MRLYVILQPTRFPCLVFPSAQFSASMVLSSICLGCNLCAGGLCWIPELSDDSPAPSRGERLDTAGTDVGIVTDFRIARWSLACSSGWRESALRVVSGHSSAIGFYRLPLRGSYGVKGRVRRSDSRGSGNRNCSSADSGRQIDTRTDDLVVRGIASNGESSDAGPEVIRYAFQVEHKQ